MTTTTNNNRSNRSNPARYIHMGDDGLATAAPPKEMLLGNDCYVVTQEPKANQLIALLNERQYKTTNRIDGCFTMLIDANLLAMANHALRGAAGQVDDGTPVVFLLLPADTEAERDDPFIFRIFDDTLYSWSGKRRNWGKTFPVPPRSATQ